MNFQSIRPDAKFGQAINEESALKSAGSVQMFHVTTFFFKYWIVCAIFLQVHISCSVLRKTYALSSLASLSSFVHWDSLSFVHCYMGHQLWSSPTVYCQSPGIGSPEGPLTISWKRSKRVPTPMRTGMTQDDKATFMTSGNCGTGKASKIRCHTGQIAGPQHLWDFWWTKFGELSS